MGKMPMLRGTGVPPVLGQTSGLANGVAVIATPFCV
jgi:hypothetical protein